MTGHVSKDAMENCQFAAKPSGAAASTAHCASVRAHVCVCELVIYLTAAALAFWCVFCQSQSVTCVGSRVKRADVARGSSSG